MKIKAGRILAAYQALTAIAQQEMAAISAFRIARAIRKLEPEAKVIEDTRNGLIRRLGKDDGKGNITVGQDRMEEFTRQLQEIGDQEIEVDVRPLPAADLPAKVTAQQILMLGELIQDEESQEDSRNVKPSRKSKSGRASN